MKKRLILSAITLSAFLFSACSSSSSSDKSLAEECEAGVSEKCLESAIWNMNAFYTPEGAIYRQLSNPTTLTFEKSGEFEIKYSTDPKIQNDGNGILGAEDIGTWTLNGSTLTLNFTVGTETHELPITTNATVTTTPTGEIQLNLGGIFVHNLAFSKNEAAYLTEIFTGIEKP
ncbi:hypothetical protein [Fibrobacter sp. UWS1]|uniref:hypothetical protein n=1 Tax=Fibrobacter sp. UWS1 TaxID=1896220 RepID=UPI000BB12E43|nr:hypothetical protein [Fibrobacter sp. UWS1]PBC67739.1 hypothetical protein BGX14_0061 [Fibrobacter sp. UWS1]